MNDTPRINRASLSFIYLSSSNIHFRLLAAEERDLTELEAVVELPVKLHIQFGAHTAQPDNQRKDIIPRGVNHCWEGGIIEMFG